MDVSSYEFSTDEIISLKVYRDKQKDSRLKIRFIAMLMLANKIDLEFIICTIGKCKKTIENWLNKYLAKGIDSLNSFQYTVKKTRLTDEQIQQLTEWVKKTNPAKAKEIREYIKDEFHVEYVTESVRQLLIKNGLGVVRPKVQPGNPPTEKEQEEHIEKYFELKSSSEPGTVFLFGDGMHLVHQNVPGLCWGDPNDPPILKTNTGRKRLNIIGAYNPDLHKLTHLTGEENCDAERTLEYLKLIMRAYRKSPKIYLYLDNATYFKAKIVRKWLKEHPKLEIKYLPPYGPNLNLIERFWRFVKEKLVKNSYYPKYKTFRAKTFRLLNHIDDHTDELKTLMVEKFQIIKHA